MKIFPVDMPHENRKYSYPRGCESPNEAQAGKCLLAGLTDNRLASGSVAASTLAAGKLFNMTKEQQQNEIHRLQDALIKTGWRLFAVKEYTAEISEINNFILEELRKCPRT